MQRVQWFSRSGGLAQRVQAVGARTPQCPPPLQSRCAPQPSRTTASHPPSGGGARWRTPPGGDDCSGVVAAATTMLHVPTARRPCVCSKLAAQCFLSPTAPSPPSTVHGSFVSPSSLHTPVSFPTSATLPPNLHPSPHRHPPPSAGNPVIDTLILSCSDVSLPSHFSLPSSPSPWATSP